MIIENIKKRFESHMERHPGLRWQQVEEKLTQHPEALRKLEAMEESGGEPDVMDFDPVSGKLLFCDFSKETPAGRRSVCYDEEALRGRTKNPPLTSAGAQAEKMGISLMDEALYRRMQETGEYDLKTSSWIDTPESVRKAGGALFCERRYGMVFVFHNGADSYYSVRGWRGCFEI